MSYSIVVRDGTKEGALKKLSEQMDDIVSGQPMHARDREAAEKAAALYLDLLPSNVDCVAFSVSVGGSIGWNSEDALTGVGFNISVRLESLTADEIAEKQAAEPAAEAAAEPSEAEDAAPAAEDPPAEADSKPDGQVQE